MIRYSYLWHAEHARGQEEGLKDRPCAVILAVPNERQDQVVVVLPITHSLPVDPSLAVEIPAAVKRRLGLDEERSWIVLSEANRFIWPGPDLRPARIGEPETVVYGLLPNRLFEQVRDRFVAAVKARQARPVSRSP